MPYIGLSHPKAEQIAAEQVIYNARYPTLKPNWSFELSTVLDGSVDEVASKLGPLDKLETVMKLNPVCFEFVEIARDWVVVPKGQKLGDVRVREVPGDTSNHDSENKGRRYERVRFEAKDTIKAFWGLMEGVVIQRGTYVWDEKKKLGLWEVSSIDKPGMEAWLRKVVKFEGVNEDGKKKTRVVEICEGYTRERHHLFDWLAERFTKDLHR
ncbi:hypothetical protein NP233_g11134 [Leucocoprinus birnbaumii]|uniref:Uncharacterized protein n=1 Tax=Leucocoprinus birnbaumii TaxID=56174 RepID=A0AAD5VJ41_9AGAR|nr:hypothetical protein NP233_g11134 [Leucocoprinus birnbaumii]